jgi:hypothetical protein
MILPLAHAGHWFAGMLYLAPVFVLGGGILWQRKNDRKLAAAKANGEDPEDGSGNESS